MANKDSKSLIVLPTGVSRDSQIFQTVEASTILAPKENSFSADKNEFSN
jgi:hypothetical protein